MGREANSAGALISQRAFELPILLDRLPCRFPLPLRRIALEPGQRMGILHPLDALGELDLDPGRHRIRVVVGGALDVDDAG